MFYEKRYDDALARYDEALGTHIQDHNIHASIRCNKENVFHYWAEFLWRNGQYEAASGKWWQAYELNGNNHDHKLRALKAMGDHFSLLEEFDVAIRKYDEAISEARFDEIRKWVQNCKDLVLSLSEAKRFLDQAKIVKSKGEKDVAVDNIVRAIEKCNIPQEIINDHSGEGWIRKYKAHAFSLWGDVLFDAKEYDTAIAKYDEALREVPDGFDKSVIINKQVETFCNWSQQLRDVGDFEGAIEKLNKGLECVQDETLKHELEGALNELVAQKDKLKSKSQAIKDEKVVVEEVDEGFVKVEKSDALVSKETDLLKHTRSNLESRMRDFQELGNKNTKSALMKAIWDYGSDGDTDLVDSAMALLHLGDENSSSQNDIYLKDV